MKLRILPTLLILSVLASLVMFMPKEQTQSDDENGPDEHPGFQEQWEIMKGLTNREMPKGLLTSWYEHDLNRASYKKKYFSGIEDVEFIGPKNVGGRTRDMLIDASNDQRILACAVSGGLWESEDLGVKWKPLNDLSPNLNITSIDQSPMDPKLIVYGTGEPRGNSSGAIGAGVFMSTDNGQTFTQVSASADIDDMTSIWDVKFSTTDKNTFYVACEDGGVYQTTDLGKSFENVFASGRDVHDIEIMPDGTIYVAAEGRGIFKSTTGKEGSFELVKGGLPDSGFDRIEMTTSAVFPKVMFCQFARGNSGTTGSSVGVWKSSNGGKTWKAVGNPQNFGGSYSFPWYALAFDMDPNDTNFLMSGCVNVTYSNNGGDTWTRARSGHADYHHFMFHPKNNGVFFTGNDGGVFEYEKSTVSSKTISRNTGYYTTQLFAGGFAPTSKSIVAGSQDNGTHYLKSFESDFDHVLGGDGAYCHLGQQDVDLAYVSTQRGAIRRTNNMNGIRPTFRSIMNELDNNQDGAIDDGAWFISPFEMNYLDDYQLYFITRKRLWLSVNSGDTWKPITNTSLNPYCVGIPYEEKPDVAYLGGEGMLLRRIEKPLEHEPGDEINLRIDVPTGIGNAFVSSVAVHPKNSSTIFITLSDYDDTPRIWRIDSTDASPVWTDISGDLPVGLPCNSIIIDPKNPDYLFTVATDFGLYSTTNGGLDWVKEERIPNVVIHQIRLRRSDRKIYAFTHGRGIWTVNLKKNPPISVPEMSRETFDVFPNPASSHINVDVQHFVGHPFSIHSLNGQLVKQGLLAKQLDVSELENGEFVLSIRDKSAVHTAHFVKI